MVLKTLLIKLIFIFFCWINLFLIIDKKWYPHIILFSLLVRYRKFLGSSGIWWNGAPSSHIHDRSHHELNKWTPPWMWEEETSFSILQKYLKITRETCSKPVSKPMNSLSTLYQMLWTWIDWYFHICEIYPFIF